MSRKLPSRAHIADYWREAGIEKLFDVDGDDCFACGDVLRLERCHIIPRWKGGPDAVHNLHVLCARCHVESESSADYWGWFNKKTFRCSVVHFVTRNTAKGAWAALGDKLKERGVTRKDFMSQWRRISEAYK